MNSALLSGKCNLSVIIISPFVSLIQCNKQLFLPESIETKLYTQYIIKQHNMVSSFLVQGHFFLH